MKKLMMEDETVMSPSLTGITGVMTIFQKQHLTN